MPDLPQHSWGRDRGVCPPPPPQLKSYYLTQQEQIAGQSVSGELIQRAGSHVISCQHVLCVSEEDLNF